jgi:hypothetical protein
MSETSHNELPDMASPAPYFNMVGLPEITAETTFTQEQKQRLFFLDKAIQTGAASSAVSLAEEFFNYVINDFYQGRRPLVELAPKSNIAQVQISSEAFTEIKEQCLRSAFNLCRSAYPLAPLEISVTVAKKAADYLAEQFIINPNLVSSAETARANQTNSSGYPSHEKKTQLDASNLNS